MTPQQKKSLETIKSFPTGLKLVYTTSDKCVRKLISTGHTPVESEECVLEVLKECEYDLNRGNYYDVVMVLKTIFNV